MDDFLNSIRTFRSTLRNDEPVLQTNLSRTSFSIVFGTILAKTLKTVCIAQWYPLAVYGGGGAWQVEVGLIMHHDLPTLGDFARLHYTSTCNGIFYISLHHAEADRQIMLPTLERSVLLMQLCRIDWVRPPPLAKSPKHSRYLREGDKKSPFS